MRTKVSPARGQQAISAKRSGKPTSHKSRGVNVTHAGFGGDVERMRQEIQTRVQQITAWHAGGKKGPRPSILTLLALVIAAGCSGPAPDLTPIPGQVSFSAAAWNRHMQRNDAPPAINWVRGADLNCGDGQGFIASTGECAYGEFIPGDSFVSIALPGSRPDWDTLCHEFTHYKRYRDHEPDPLDHSTFPYESVAKCAADVAVLQGELP